MKAASRAGVIPASPSVRESQAAHHWQKADSLAAVARLTLARRRREAFDQLDYEPGNLQASQAWLATQTGVEAAQLLLGYLETLAPYLRQRGLHLELLNWCEAALQACGGLKQKLGWIFLLRSEAQYALGHWDEAIAGLESVS